MNVQFPDKLSFLFQPHRYKVAHGGRGSAKSWSFARALLIQAASTPLRVLCTREVQKSIAQSVHQLLSDQIQAMGLSGFYEVLQTTIRGKNGSAFYFSGLSDQTSASLKSFEGVERVWVEEAQAVTKRSWDILTPTIRKDGSEIWVTFNPELDTDETYRRFVATPPPDCVTSQVNYTDNPWFPDVLEAERLHAKATMSSADYAHIWEGKCKPAVAGAIYFEQIQSAQEGKRIREVPHDPTLKTHVVWDLGFNDSMSLILCQRVASELRIVHYIEDSHRTLSDYVAELKDLRLDGERLNWGNDFLPHDGYAKRHQTGKSDEQVLTGLGRTVLKVPNMEVEAGIKRAREAFSRMYFHQERAARLVECLKRYRRHINQQTNEPGAPLHDEYSHGADAFRYLSIVADQMSNDNWKPIKYKSMGIV